MWKLMEIANGRKSCDNPDLKSSDIPAVLSVIEKNFEISYNKKGAIGLDTVGLDFQINEKHVTVGWDNWSGLFIMSREPDGDNVIERIFDVLAVDEKE